MDMIDIHMAIKFSGVQLDELDEPTHGYHVQTLDLEFFGYDDKNNEERPIGSLECFLFDVVGASSDEKGSSLFEEADAESESMEFYEFLFYEDLIRGRLLHRLNPEHYENDDDEEFEVSNVLCVSGGWWGCTQEVLMRAISRAARVLRFDYVCVDSACIRLGSSKMNWRDRKPPNEDGMKLPEPFIKVIWKELVPEEHLTHPDRWFYFGQVPEDEIEFDEKAEVTIPSSNEKPRSPKEGDEKYN
jgi:hypothetical protein